MKLGLLTISLFLFMLPVAMATSTVDSVMPNPDSTNLHQVEESHSKKFKPVDFIFDHVGDSHEWHIVTIGNTHISVPLPVILYSKTRKQLYSFLSSKFHHGHDTYKGFKLMLEGDLKGKIVELDSSGHILESSLPLDFSIKKNVFGLFVSMLVIGLIFIPVANKYKSMPNTAPSGMQGLMETLILFVRDDVVRPSIGDRHYNRFMPFMLTIFFFIFINNLLGLIPIFPFGANITGNIAVTMTLAVFTLGVILLNGNKHFYKDIVNPQGVPIFLKLPIPIMPVVEAASWIIKPGVLMIRLFANIFAGHIIAMVLFSLIFIFGAINIYFGYGISVVTVVLTTFMALLELLVSFIQAFVFTMLSALFIGMAVAEHH